MKETGWRFSVQEVVAFLAGSVGVAVTITLWCVSTFQTRADASDFKASVEKRFEAQEMRLDSIQSSLNSMGADLSFIRGKLERKNE